MSEQQEFKVGDKVKQTQQHYPYGRLVGGEYLGDKVGTVVEVTEGVTYSISVRLDDADTDAEDADIWPFKASELTRVEQPVEEPSLYENVAALTPGSIFIVGQGDPWIRTRRGVTHLYSVRDGVAYGNMEIPEGWKTYEIRDITVLYEPTQGRVLTPEKTKVYVVTGVDYDSFEIDEVFATREDAEARVVEIKAGRALGVDSSLIWTVEEKEVQ